MKRAFLQFYCRDLKQDKDSNFIHVRDDDVMKFYAVQNGFSSVWDLANPIWVEVDPFKKIKPNLPVEADEIYCSLFLEFEFSTVCDWAEENPKIKFILGGPTIWPKRDLEVTIRKPLPENVELRTGLAEDIFDVSWNPERWYVELPKLTDFDSPPMYSYYVYDECYWGKCTFCKIYGAVESKWKRGYGTFGALEKAPPGIVWLAGDSLPGHIIEMIPDLPQDKKYIFFMRAGEDELKSVERFIKKIPYSNEVKYHPEIGIEMPSSRMLKRMNKGITLENLTKVLNVLSSHPSVRPVCAHMIGWQDLIEEDIQEAKRFYEGLENPDNIKFVANWMMLPKGEKPFKSKYRIMAYYSQLKDEEQIKLNKEYLKLLTKQKRCYVSTFISQELNINISEYWK